MSVTQLPVKDREFAATLEALRAPCIGYRTTRFIDEAKRWIDFGALLEFSAQWSTGERLMVKVAIAMWGREDMLPPEECATIGQAITTFDGENLDVLINAMWLRRYGVRFSS